MSVYAVANYTVHNPEMFERYLQQATPIVLAHGGKILVLGDGLQVVEGSNSNEILAILEFPSVEAVMGWYQSPEYQSVVGLRHSSTSGWAVVAPGFTLP